jgi:hypothetical protein
MHRNRSESRMAVDSAQQWMCHRLRAEIFAANLGGPHCPFAHGQKAPYGICRRREASRGAAHFRRDPGIVRAARQNRGLPLRVYGGRFGWLSLVNARRREILGNRDALHAFDDRPWAGRRADGRQSSGSAMWGGPVRLGGGAFQPVQPAPRQASRAARCSPRGARSQRAVSALCRHRRAKLASRLRRAKLASHRPMPPSRARS